MLIITLAALAAALIFFAWIGMRARAADTGIDDYFTARNSQGAGTLGLSFLASGMGAWILFAPPEVGAFVGPVAVVGYAIGAALPFVVFAFCGPRVRRLMPGGRSLGEFVRLRYGPVMHRWVIGLSVAYMLCFVTAELTAAGAVTSLLTDLNGRIAIIGVAFATLLYTAWGGLRASLVTDRWQAWLLLALLIIVGIVAVSGLQRGGEWQVPAVPLGGALSTAATLVIAVTVGNLFHQGYWQRLWAARSNGALGWGAAIGALTTIAVVLTVGGLGVLAAATGLKLGDPPLPFFALIREASPWVALTAVLLGVTLVASSVDTIENGLASLVVAERPRLSLTGARWITVALMLPAILVALQGYSVLRLFLVADLLCATAAGPVLMGLWPRVGSQAALAGAVAGVAGAVLPGWVSEGSFIAGLRAATFPGAVPTLGPFAGALIASTVIAFLVALLYPRSQ